MSRVFYLVMLFSLLLISAYAIQIETPINNFNYDTNNILLNITNENIENLTLCNITYNVADSEYDFDSNESYSYYLNDIEPTNSIEIECDDNTSDSVVFYYEETDSDLTNIWIVPMLFLIFSIIAFLLFKK